MKREFITALEEIERTKGVSKEIIFDALEKALKKSYQKNFEDNENAKVEIDTKTGNIKVYAIKKVVENPENEILEISLDEALKINKKINLDDEITIEVTPKNFGRIAAQTAKNIVIQKIKDAERDIIYDEFVDREKEIITGIVHRIEQGVIYIDLGKIEGIVPISEQIKSEHYKVNDRLKLYIKEVKNTPKGAQVILSRTDPGLIKRLLELEIPEIEEGIVEIYSIAREAGSRTKLAVFSKNLDIDSVGSCVGHKGNRIKSIVDELNGEKIDIIVWNTDPKIFIGNSLSPAEVLKVFVKDKQKVARVIVEEEQLSLAIGKEGQNARLSAKLTSWKIDIKGKNQYFEGIESGNIPIEFEGEKEFLIENNVKIKESDIDEN